MAEWIVEITDGLPHLKNMKPLVRCKDCKHRHKAEVLFQSGYYCELCHIDSEMENCDDWFCADGVRKE